MPSDQPLFALTQLALGLAPNVGQILAFRFLAGFVGSVPLTVTAGSLADVFDKSERGAWICLFALTGAGGAVLGPVPSGWLAQYAGWRWGKSISPRLCSALLTRIFSVFHLNTILATVTLFIVLFFLPETRARKPARRSSLLSFTAFFQEDILLPFRLLFGEPIVLSMAFYNGYVYVSKRPLVRSDGQAHVSLTSGSSLRLFGSIAFDIYEALPILWR